jgi:hypothetical protein
LLDVNAMKSFLWRCAAACSLLAVYPVAVACSSPDAGSKEDDSTDAELSIEFPEMYSAFDGEHSFKVPAVVEGVKKGVKWSASPADAVDLEPGSDGSVMIIVKQAVDVTITAKVGSLKATAPLKITQATAEDWENGKERYTNGVTFAPRGGRDGGGGGGGGGKNADGGRGERKVDPLLACTNCHARGGDKADIEHTPMQTAGYSDEDLAKIFTQGTKPPGVKMRTPAMSASQWQKIHRWQMEDDEKAGIIVYLRSLEPESQGDVDFGGKGVWGGGGKGSGNGNGKKGRDGGTGGGGGGGDAGAK